MWTHHKDWAERLITSCVPGLSESEWWVIGGQMHTLSDDYKFLYPEDYEKVKSLLDGMWHLWILADPRKNKGE